LALLWLSLSISQDKSLSLSVGFLWRFLEKSGKPWRSSGEGMTLEGA
jgi:hypothetical protein